MSEPLLLQVAGLSSGYGGSRVLFDLSLDVARNETVAILGSNGAGKTTLLKCLAGEVPAWTGSIRFDGSDIVAAPTTKRIRDGIGYVPQEQGIFARLTVRDNLEIGALRHGGGLDIDGVLQIFPKLKGRLGQVSGTLSGGERKMLAISRALLGGPKLLLLDEPTEGVWIGVIEEIAERLQSLAASTSILIVEQHLELALRLAQRAYVMERGTVALSGSADAIRDDPRLLALLSP